VSSKNPLSVKIINSGIFNNLNSFYDLENRIENVQSLNNRSINLTKGDIFEIFIEALLSINNKYKCKDVYPAGKIPLKLNQRLDLNTNEKGHDGVYENDGELACYQVKYRKNENLTWDELSTFIGVSEKAEIRHLFTNCSNISKEFLNKSKVRITKREDLINLKKHEFQEIEGWLRNKKITIKKHIPEKYQNEAIIDIYNDLRINDRTTAIMACGSGKTDVGLWVYEKINPNLSVVFVPSIALVKQIRSDWLEQINNKEIKTIQVCSAKHKTDREDSIILNEIDLDFKITLDEKTIKKFINQNKKYKKIIFSTYQSSDVLAKSLKGVKVDFAIFDEAHRTATIRKLNQSRVSNFQLPLLNENIFIKKRLFMTATRRISSKKEFRKEGDSKLSLSMDNEFFYGKVSHNLSFYRAMKLGCIAKFKIAYSVVTSDEVDTYKRKISATLVKKNKIKSEQVAKQIALKKIINKLNIKKIFSFHRTVNRSKSFVSNGPEGIGTHLPKFYCNHVDGTMKISDREKITETFKNSNFGILSNARCLIEGVDVPSVELVSFSDKKNSEIDIIQSAGRALRNRNVKKKYGYLFVPIFVEKKKNEQIKDALARSNYELIVEILNAIKDHDTEIAQIIKNYFTDDTKGYSNAKKQFDDLFEKDKDIISLELLNKSIKNKIKDRVITRWDFYLNKLKLYIEENKHSLTPIIFLNKKKINDNEKFYQWVHNIKLRKRSGDLMNYQIQELEKIGIDWRIKGETLTQNQTTNLITQKKLNKDYFWAGRNLSKLIKPKGLFYTTKLTEYYSINDFNLLKKKFDKIINPNDKNYLSLYQIAKKLNLTDVFTKRESKLRKIFDKWIHKTGIDFAGYRFSKGASKGTIIEVYPSKIVDKIIEQNNLLFKTQIDNRTIFTQSFLENKFLIKSKIINKKPVYGYFIFSGLQKCYHYKNLKDNILNYYNFIRYNKDKNYILMWEAINKFNFTTSISRPAFRRFYDLKMHRVLSQNNHKFFYFNINDLKKVQKEIKKFNKDEKKYIYFSELEKKLGAGNNPKLVYRAFEKKIFKIAGYHSNTYNSKKVPFTYRSKENLSTIKRINFNINVPKNLVNQSYILDKFNIQYTTINKMIKNGILKPYTYRVSEKDPLSKEYNQPYFLKSKIDSFLLKLKSHPKNILGISDLSKKFKIDKSTLSKWVKNKILIPDYWLAGVKQISSKQKFPYFKNKNIDGKISKSIIKAKIYRSESQKGFNNPYYKAKKMR
jgi:superfamily II DNA or RNA helicase